MHSSFRKLFTASAAAILATAPALPVWSQEVGKIPISAVVVSGLDSPAGAQILLIRATGAGCRDSMLVPVNSAGAERDNQYYTVATGRKEEWAEALLYRTGIKVGEGCWCSDPDAGLAVMAPGKAVAYRSNRESLRRPSEEEKKTSAEGVRIFGLCTADEVRIDMRPRREVRVTVWVSDGESRSMAKDDLANLDWILDDQLAGITVRPDYRLLNADHSLNHELPACYPAKDEDACCASVRRSRLFDPAGVNLYYGTGSGNFTCPDVPASFVHDAPILGDAAHELSHALGLNQSDHLDKYDTGHTRNHPLFHWSNVMWDQTQFLKDKLSPAQAFWMSQSCGSWFGLNASCLNCTQMNSSAKAGAPPPSSPCPPFSQGAEGPPSEGELCTGPPACAVRTRPESASIFVPARRKKPTDNCELPETIYKDGKALETQLKERYSLLKKHVRGRDDLRLGSVTSWDFLRRWEPSFAYDIATGNSQDALPGALHLGKPEDLRKKPLPECAPSSPTTIQTSGPGR